MDVSTAVQVTKQAADSAARTKMYRTIMAVVFM
jgi:hypothetical protein